MIEATIYRQSSGQILWQIQCDNAEGIFANLNEGDGWIVGAFSAERFYVLGGQAVEFPVRPGEWAEWDWSLKQWLDPRDETWTSQQRDLALEELRAERDLRIQAMQWRLQRWRDEKDLDISPTTEDGLALLSYVQALRDMPATCENPAEPVWPTAPSDPTA